MLRGGRDLKPGVGEEASPRPCPRDEGEGSSRAPRVEFLLMMPCKNPDIIYMKKQRMDAKFMRNKRSNSSGGINLF